MELYENPESTTQLTTVYGPQHVFSNFKPFSISQNKEKFATPFEK